MIDFSKDERKLFTGASAMGAIDVTSKDLPLTIKGRSDQLIVRSCLVILLNDCFKGLTHKEAMAQIDMRSLSPVSQDEVSHAVRRLSL